MRGLRVALACTGLALAWAFLACTATAGGTEIPADAFIGIWRLQLTPNSEAKQDGAKEFKEAIMFEDSQLMAENFASYGFSPGAYAIPEDQPCKFTATLESNTKGNLAWSGAIQSGRLSGELVWTKQDGKVWKFTYVGSK